MLAFTSVVAAWQPHSAAATRTAFVLAVAAGVVACHPTVELPVSPAEAKRAASAAELARAELERRLADTEAKLSTARDEQHGELAARRLVLTVALVELERRIAGGETAGPDIEGLLTSVELMMTARRSSQTRAPGKRRGETKETASQPPLEERDFEPEEPIDKPLRIGWGKKDKPKAAVAAERGEQDSNGFGGEADKKPADDLEGKMGRIEKARVEVEARPRGLMTAVQRQIGALEACLGQLDDDVTLQVTVSMDAGGAVRIAKVGGVAGAPATCLARVLQRVRVPDHDGGTRIVRFPLYFQPR